jgi:hypothetical protein
MKPAEDPWSNIAQSAMRKHATFEAVIPKLEKCSDKRWVTTLLSSVDPSTKIGATVSVVEL